MPRKGRGGERQGTPGTAYGNRTDLNQPISTVPNQEYGMATAQREAQQAIPMASSPVASAPDVPTQPAGKPLPRPGELPHLEPTARPSEPVTAGIDYGPGAGSEAMAATRIPLASQIAANARNNPSPVLSELSALASSMGL
jgi:hypothetical protein